VRVGGEEVCIPWIIPEIGSKYVRVLLN
jgi:hypothetical protein